MAALKNYNFFSKKMKLVFSIIFKFILAAAALILLAGAARTRAVFTDNAFPNSLGMPSVGIVAAALAGYFSNLLALDFLLTADLYGEYHLCGIFPYGLRHLVKHVVALVAVFDNRVVLTICT